MAKLKAWKGIGPHYPNQDCADRFDQLLVALADPPEEAAPFPWESAWTSPWPQWACARRAQIFEHWDDMLGDWRHTHTLFKCKEAQADGVVIWHSDEINAWYAAAGKALGAL